MPPRATPRHSGDVEPAPPATYPRPAKQQGHGRDTYASASTTNRPGRRVPAAAAGQAAARRGSGRARRRPPPQTPAQGTQHPHPVAGLQLTQLPTSLPHRSTRAHHGRLVTTLYGRERKHGISCAASRTGPTCAPGQPSTPSVREDTFPQVGSPPPRPVTALQRRQARIGAHTSACASLPCRECLVRECICLCRSCRQVTLMESWGTDTMACTAASAAAMVVMVGTPRLTAARRIS